ncbi:Sialin-like 7 [Homarus americanus]|uniref:Sialin-like 7 n=1 Tax=Homarus americanus TaxID=6706 RepID=A0A8J5T8A2_HOMAM|nr:Sialin-like 7 [Homarus americanus]
MCSWWGRQSLTRSTSGGERYQLFPIRTRSTCLQHALPALPCPARYSSSPTAACLPARYVVSLLAFMGVMFNYILRVNINFALVAMVSHGNMTAAGGPPLNATFNASVSYEEVQEGSTPQYNDFCPAPDANATPHTSYNGDLPWDEWTQGLVAGAFYYGNILSQVPGGRLAEVWGPSRVVGGSLFSAGLLTLLQPLAARTSYIVLILLRVLVGLALGVTSPANHALLSGWAPKMERSTMAAIIYAGAPAGTLVAFPVSAYIIEKLGWEAVFYLQGALALVWCLAWFLNATLSGLPYLGMWMLSLGTGVVGDFFQLRCGTSIVSVRKISHIIANVGPAMCLVGLMWVGCDWLATVTLLVAGVTAQGALYAGPYINPIDLSPNFAGTLCGISNTIGNIPGFLAPMFNGYLLNNQQTLPQWRKVFIIAVVFYLLNTIFYLIFASGEVQPWNSPRPHDPESVDAQESQHSNKATTTTTTTSSQERYTTQRENIDHHSGSDKTNEENNDHREGNCIYRKGIKQTRSSASEGSENNSHRDGDTISCCVDQSEEEDAASVQVSHGRLTWDTEDQGHVNLAYSNRE